MNKQAVLTGALGLMVGVALGATLRTASDTATEVHAAAPTLGTSGYVLEEHVVCQSWECVCDPCAPCEASGMAVGSVLTPTIETEPEPIVDLPDRPEHEDEDDDGQVVVPEPEPEPEPEPTPTPKPKKEKGNNGVGNGEDPQPPGNPPINDGPGTSPGNPGNKGHGNDKPKKEKEEK